MAAMTIKTGARLMGLALASLSMAAQAAEEKPLWEVGAGVAAFSFPAYRGSDRDQQFPDAGAAFQLSRRFFQG
jgi:outer membrane protein